MTLVLFMLIPINVFASIYCPPLDAISCKDWVCTLKESYSTDWILIQHNMNPREFLFFGGVIPHETNGLEPGTVECVYSTGYYDNANTAYRDIGVYYKIPLQPDMSATPNKWRDINNAKWCFPKTSIWGPNSEDIKDCPLKAA